MLINYREQKLRLFQRDISIHLGPFLMSSYYYKHKRGAGWCKTFFKREYIDNKLLVSLRTIKYMSIVQNIKEIWGNLEDDKKNVVIIIIIKYMSIVQAAYTCRAISFLLVLKTLMCKKHYHNFGVKRMNYQKSQRYNIS